MVSSVGNQEASSQGGGCLGCLCEVSSITAMVTYSKVAVAFANGCSLRGVQGFGGQMVMKAALASTSGLAMARTFTSLSTWEISLQENSTGASHAQHTNH